MKSPVGHPLRMRRHPLTAGWITTTRTAASGTWRIYPQTNFTITSPQVSTPPVCCHNGSNDFVLDLGALSFISFRSTLGGRQSSVRFFRVSPSFTAWPVRYEASYGSREWFLDLDRDLCSLVIESSLFPAIPDRASVDAIPSNPEESSLQSFSKRY